MTVVLDASAYLAYAQDEAGADEVERAMADDDAIMSTVNVAEVLTKFTDFAPLPFVPGVVTPLPGAVTVEPFTEVDASLVASLRPITRPHGLSLGDRACLPSATDSPCRSSPPTKSGPTSTRPPPASSYT